MQSRLRLFWPTVICLFAFVSTGTAQLAWPSPGVAIVSYPSYELLYGPYPLPEGKNGILVQLHDENPTADQPELIEYTFNQDGTLADSLRIPVDVTDLSVIGWMITEDNHRLLALTDDTELLKLVKLTNEMDTVWTVDYTDSGYTYFQLTQLVETPYGYMVLTKETMHRLRCLAFTHESELMFSDIVLTPYWLVNFKCRLLDSGVNVWAEIHNGTQYQMTQVEIDPETGDYDSWIISDGDLNYNDFSISDSYVVVLASDTYQYQNLHAQLYDLHGSLMDTTNLALNGQYGEIHGTSGDRFFIETFRHAWVSAFDIENGEFVAAWDTTVQASYRFCPDSSGGGYGLTMGNHIIRYDADGVQLWDKDFTLICRYNVMVRGDALVGYRRDSDPYFLLEADTGDTLVTGFHWTGTRYVEVHEPAFSTAPDHGIRALWWVTPDQYAHPDESIALATRTISWDGSPGETIELPYPDEGQPYLAVHTKQNGASWYGGSHLYALDENGEPLLDEPVPLCTNGNSCSVIDLDELESTGELVALTRIQWDRYLAKYDDSGDQTVSLQNLYFHSYHFGENYFVYDSQSEDETGIAFINLENWTHHQLGGGMGYHLAVSEPEIDGTQTPVFLRYIADFSQDYEYTVGHVAIEHYSSQGDLVLQSTLLDSIVGTWTPGGEYDPPYYYGPDVTGAINDSAILLLFISEYTEYIQSFSLEGVPLSDPIQAPAQGYHFHFDIYPYKDTFWIKHYDTAWLVYNDLTPVEGFEEGILFAEPSNRVYNDLLFLADDGDLMLPWRITNEQFNTCCIGLQRLNHPVYDSAPERMIKPEPSSYLLVSAWPNPFNSSVRIAVDLSGRVFLDLSVYDILGRRVVQLADQSYQAGTHSFVWAGKGVNGLPVASGSYFVQVTSGKQKAVRKIQLVK